MNLEIRGNENADLAGIMIHGRGATTGSIINLSGQLEREDIYIIAPQAETREWYPNRFIAPINKNQPHLDNALRTVDKCFEKLLDKGFEKENIFLLGFSQGACLALEYAARNPCKYKAVIGLSGGLIGPLGKEFDHRGNMQKTEVFLGCSEKDPHIPVERVEETAHKFEELNAVVNKKIYPGGQHTINEDEISKINEILS